MTDNPTMMEFSEDIATAEKPDPLPAGTYLATIRSAEIGTSQKGNNYAKVGFFIGSDQYPVDFTDGNPDGMTLFFNRLMMQDTKPARWQIKQFVEKIGAPMPSRSVDLSPWVGLQANVVVKIGNYNGEDRPEIAAIERA